MARTFFSLIPRGEKSPSWQMQHGLFARWVSLNNSPELFCHIVRRKVSVVVADPAVGYADSHATTEATAIFNVTTSGAAVYERANNTPDDRRRRPTWYYSGITTGEFTPVFPEICPCRFRSLTVLSASSLLKKGVRQKEGKWTFGEYILEIFQ